jgi:uncharacterized protein with PIN domain
MKVNQAPVCPDCNGAMMWHSARHLKVGRMRRVFDIFHCDSCGRFSWADLEPRALNAQQSQRHHERSRLSTAYDASTGP